MKNGLLIASRTWKLILSYGVYALIIFVGLVLLAWLRRKAKKQLRPEWVKNRVLRAKAYAQKLLVSSAKGLQVLLGSTHLLKLKDYVADAAWAAFEIVSEKKDIVFEGVANALDAIASELVKESEDGIISAKVYEEDLQKAVEEMDAVLMKIDAIIAARG